MKNTKWTYCLLAILALSTMGIQSPAFAKRSAKKTKKKVKLNQVVISGSRSSQRTLTDTATAVDVITEEAIQNASVVRVDEILREQIPSFDIPKPTISDGTDSIWPITLRRLGTDQVLVLINGKRRHKSALVHVNTTVGRGSPSTDINAIPTNMIKRIEVLRDGASALYGSDAIAGVINIILKDGYSADTVGVNSGIHEKGDGALLELTSNYSLPAKRLSKYLPMKHLKNHTLTAGAKLKLKGGTDRSGLDPRCNYVNNNRIPCPKGLNADEDKFDRDNFWFGDNQVYDFHLWYNLTNKRSKKGLYSFGGASYRNSLGPGFYRQARSERNIPAVYPDGFLPKIRTNIIDASTVVGMKRRFGSWNGDVSVNLGYNSFGLNVENSLNVSLGVNTPTEVHSGTLSEYMASLNLDLTGQKGKIFGSKVYVATGAELRYENYSIGEGDEASWVDGGKRAPNTGGRGIPGIQVLPGFGPDNALNEGRVNVGAYGEASAQFKKLFVQTALRSEYYSDFGLATTGKLAAQYKISPMISLRSSLGTGFRAPSLSQKYVNNTSTLSTPNKTDLVQTGTFNHDSDLAKTIKLPALEEEQSISATAGVTVNWGKRAKTTLDVYQTRIQDRVTVSRTFSKSDFGSLLTSDPKYRSIKQVQFFINGLDLEAKGIDLVHQGSMPYKSGDITYGISANVGSTELLKVHQLDTIKSNKALLDDTTIALLTTALPDSRVALKVGYDFGPWSTSLSATRYGEYTLANIHSDGAYQTYSAKWVADTRVSKMFKKKNYKVSLGINNLLNTLPDENIEGSSANYNGIFPYPRQTTPFSFNGRYYYVNVSYLL